MPNLTTLFYNLTITNKTKHYIETGTYLGDGIKSTMNNYENVHSIELSEKWYHHNLEQFKENNNVKMYLGDSKLILPELLNDIQEPVTIYLDAHYSGGTTEFGAEETPLLFELEILKNRTYDDIIIIDDCRLLGKQGKCGSPDHPVYPEMLYDWRDITENKIINLMKKDYVLLKNDGQKYTDGAEDQFILCKKKLVETLKINYINNSSPLCDIGRKYDTDKSSQRYNVTDHRHCHPYTLFYDGLFKHKKNEQLNIAELGILDGGSLLMWREYFANSNIYGFEYNDVLINNFKYTYDNDRINLYNINVKEKESIKTAFSNLNLSYDIIIEDTTHLFEDQIRVIENVYEYLKPGGVLIIEDIFKKYDEKEYIKFLMPILHHFQDYYFIELDHVNRNSTGWDNDKLFVLIKGGGEPIFKNTNKLTIITPSYRTDNLLEIYKSINFNYVEEWIIVYDENKITKNPEIFKDNDKIKEYICKDENSVFGNAQRNHALTNVTNPNTILYYLDDDNTIHPNLYLLLNIVENDKLYTFNLHNIFTHNIIKCGYIDTSMFLVPYKLYKDEKWILDKQYADGLYIESIYNKNKNIHIYVNNYLCYHNTIIH